MEKILDRYSISKSLEASLSAAEEELDLSKSNT